jgi:hypothetical protein
MADDDWCPGIRSSNLLLRMGVKQKSTIGGYLTKLKHSVHVRNIMLICSL